MAHSLSELETQISKELESGRTPSARQRLKNIQKAPPRDWAYRFAELARKAGLFDLSIRFLNPYVRPSPKNPLKPTDEEKLCYAAALVKVGARDEAGDLLRQISPRRFPDVLLFQAHVLMGQWDYARAIPLLESLLKTIRRDAQKEMITKLNLAACFVFNRQDAEALPLLADLRKLCTELHSQVHLGNTLEISAQHEIFQKRWKEAERFLTEAEKQVSQFGGLPALFVKKWRAVLNLRRNPNSTVGKNALKAVITEATDRKHWETLRDCDLFLGLIEHDETLLRHVYFGTPYEEFRKRVFIEHSAPIHIPDQYEWVLKEGRGPLVDVLSGPDSLELGHITYRLFQCLVSDFYRPQGIYSIHASLHPDEYFNPQSTPARVHQAIRRLRTWLQAKRIPITIEEDHGQYRLTGQRPCRLLVPRSELWVVAETQFLTQLKERFGESPFSISEIETMMRIPARTLLRRIQSAIKDDKVERLGSGPATRYAIKEAA